MRRGLMNKDTYWKVKDVMQFLKCSECKAYEVMRQLNDEMKKEGKITIRGRVPRMLVIRRTCGEDAVA